MREAAKAIGDVTFDDPGCACPICAPYLAKGSDGATFRAKPMGTVAKKGLIDGVQYERYTSLDHFITAGRNAQRMRRRLRSTS